MTLKLILLIALGEIFICSAQFLFKAGANNLQTHSLNTVREYIAFIKSSLLVPAIWGGVFLNTLAIIVWILVLALIDLSFAIPLDSVHYIAIMLGSHFFLKERLTWERVSGSLLIAAGIVLVAMG